MEKNQKIDCTNFFNPLNPRKNTNSQIIINLNNHTYLPDGELENGWLPKYLDAFRKLTQTVNNTNKINSICSIGVGPGIELIIAAELFAPSRYILTDIHDSVLPIAKSNLIGNCKNISDSNIEYFKSNVCEEVINKQIKVDLIYENLPNLPLAKVFDLFENSRSASFFDPKLYSNIPKEINLHRLGLHYIFLKQALSCLNPGGFVLCCVGARVPLKYILEMFCELGYVPEILVADMVLQLASDLVLPTYKELETKENISFAFFPYLEGLKIINDLKEKNTPIENILQNENLNSLKLSANEAYIKFNLDKMIGHLGVIIKGTPR